MTVRLPTEIDKPANPGAAMRGRDGGLEPASGELLGWS